MPISFFYSSLPLLPPDHPHLKWYRWSPSRFPGCQSLSSIPVCSHPRKKFCARRYWIGSTVKYYTAVAATWEYFDWEKSAGQKHLWKPKRLIHKGMAASVFTILLRINPTPISRNNMITDINSSSKKVRAPCTSVKCKKKWPKRISTTTFSNWIKDGSYQFPAYVMVRQEMM